MHVSRARLTDYSSFIDTDWLQLSPRLNVVIGQNNSGKSSFLAAIGPTLPNRPHRDESRYLPGDLKSAIAYLEIKTSTAEIRSKLAATGLTVQTVGNGPTVADQTTIINLFETDAELTLKVKCEGGQSLAALTD